MVALSNVQYGLSNDDVRIVQEALIARGFDIPAGATGYFGDQTKAAYAAFEQSIGYTPPGGGTVTVKLSDVQYGKTNTSVERVQDALIAEGFSIPAGSTGYFGDQTKAAYSSFQQSLGYSGAAADGNPGCTSLTTLGNRRGFAVSCDVPDGGGTGSANSPTAGAISKSSVQYSKNSGIPTGQSTFVTYANQAADKTGVPRSWVTGHNGCSLITLASRESSFNPNAVNTSDSNATGPIVGDGNPENCSRGYCQTIPGTFAAYHEEGTSSRIYEPVANIAAAINYIRARYGSIENVQQANPNLPPRGY